MHHLELAHGLTRSIEILFRHHHHHLLHHHHTPLQGLFCGSVVAIAILIVAFAALLWGYNVAVSFAISIPFYIFGLAVRLCFFDSVETVLKSEFG